MFKKVTAFCFILFANIVLLAHAVIPHHHYYSNSQVSVCYFSATSDFEEHESHAGHAHSHSHQQCHFSGNKGHENDLSYYCILNSPYLQANNKEKLFSPEGESSSPTVSYTPLFAIVPIEDIVITDFGGCRQLQSPVIQTFNRPFLINSSGLRAPPVS